MSKLQDMPVVTAEQVIRFREEALRIERDYVLMDIQLNHRTSLLSSCDEALRQRDEQVIDLLRHRDDLLDAVNDVLQYRIGCLPLRGDLRDNDKSRAALERLSSIAKAQGGV